VPRVLIAGDNKAHFGRDRLRAGPGPQGGIEQVSIETRVRDTGK
jgi:hypothetical protein